MDIEALVAVRRDEWERLAQLERQRRPTGKQADEFVARYQSAAADLSFVRSAEPDPYLVRLLSTRVAQARGRLTGSALSFPQVLATFFQVQLPAALYRIRWWTVVVMVAFIGIAFWQAWWLLTEPGALATLGTPMELDTYAKKSFTAYYSNYPAPEFAAQVWTNNARLAALAVSLGITGIYPLWMLVGNALAVGEAGAILASRDMTGVFFASILPHGMLELTAVFIAVAAGLRLFWVLLVPGPRPRSVALAVEGRALITVAIGLTIVLAWSGGLEGFLTASSLPLWTKLAIGGGSTIALWVYTLVFGRRAVRAAETGDLTADQAGYAEKTLG